jgi:hypothetical protein
MKRTIIIEGKKEDIAKKLKQKFEYDSRFIDRVLSTDPTGYKYVDYIGRKIEDIIPRLTSKVGGLNVQQSEALLDLFGVVIPWFNNNSDKIGDDDIWKADTVYRGRIGLNVPNINGIADAPKDINTYEDPEFIKDLMNIIDGRKSEGEKEKEIKSQAEKLYEDDDVLVIRPKSHLASCYYGANTKWCTTTKESPSYFEKYVRNGKLYYFINKKTGLKNALYVDNDRDIKVFDAKDNEILLNDFRENFPSQDALIDDLTGMTHLIKALRKFSKGQITARELEESDPAIYDVKIKEPLGSSIITINFEDDDEFFKTLDLDENDVWFAKTITSYYGNYEFMDSYNVDEDFKEGYIIYGDLNDENLDKLEKISSVILPEKEFDLKNDEFTRELSRRLVDLFEREMDWIIEDYLSEKNSEMTKTAEESINKEINGLLDDLGFVLDRSYDLVKTTPANLIMWAAKLNTPKTDAISLFNQIVENHGKSIGGWYDNSYDFRDYDNFDKESFNRTVEKYFDEILEKIEDSSDIEGGGLKNFIEMMGRIKSKFKLNTWYKLPKDKLVNFKISGFDRDKMKINVSLKTSNKGYLRDKSISLSEENFYKLLYQNELFDIFGDSE